jgi:2-keto-4-pentenoate hydratase/2-oxohepta-3-ene-1,7-dioic acid hydratase in catechol pathway
MKIARLQAQGDVFYGAVQDDRLCVMTNKERDAPLWRSLSEGQLLAPVQPTKIVAVGLNYRDHAEEVGLPVPEEPILFLKPASSLLGPGDAIVIPPRSARVDYEAELAVVIGKTARKASGKDARDCILGYTCLNDVTARDLQGKDGQWTRAKGFDAFCPIGPWIETELDPSDLSIELFLNGERKQHSRTSNLIFDPVFLVEFVSHVMTLNPGDVIATGTTSGIGPMKPGDTVEVRIEGIGSLVNRVEQG